MQKRLDQYVIDAHPALSRSYAVRLIIEGKVTVNGLANKPGYKLRENDTVNIDFDSTELDNIPEIDLPILYEDDDVIVINKPTGVISHARGRYWDEPSVASFIRQKFLQLRKTDFSSLSQGQTEGVEQRAGIVHRLDRATSGVMICAKNQAALSWLQTQFAERTVTKTYQAVASGHFSDKELLIDLPIERNPKQPSTFRVGAQGKPAQTRLKVLKEGDLHTSLELLPLTGRTHQLRVHLAHIGHPIVGDVLYGGETAERLFLHARSLEIALPSGKRQKFTAPLPKEFEQKLTT